MTTDWEGDRPRPPGPELSRGGNRSSVLRTHEDLAAATHFRPDLSPDSVNYDLESLARYIGKACDRYRALEETMRALGISGGDRMRELSDAVHGCAQITRLLGYPTPADKENGGG